jgi:hypothetical protein
MTHNQANDELRELVGTIRGASPYDHLPSEYASQSAVPSDLYNEAQETMFAKLTALIHSYANKARIEAQENAVAWCVGVLDEFHNMPHEYSAERDKFYKGAKNGIRDRYRSETGVDPAPNYPIRAELEKSK